MSAIGDYVFYKSSNYDSSEAFQSQFPQGQNYINLRQASASYQYQKQRIANEMHKMNDSQMASEVESFLNLLINLTKNSDPKNVQAYFSKDEVKRYKELVMKNLNELYDNNYTEKDINFETLMLKHPTIQPNKVAYDAMKRIKAGEEKMQKKVQDFVYTRDQLYDDLQTVVKYMTSSEGQEALKKINRANTNINVGVYVETLNQLFKQENQKVQGQLRKLSPSLKKYFKKYFPEGSDERAEIEALMGKYHVKDGGGITVKLNNALNQIDTIVKKGLSNKEVTKDTLLGTINTLINALCYTPADIVGYLNEAAYAAGIELLSQMAYSTIQTESIKLAGQTQQRKQIGNLSNSFVRSSFLEVKKTLHSGKSKLGFKPEYTGYKVEIDEKTGACTITENETSQKVDVTFNYIGPDSELSTMDTTIKHTDNKYVTHIIQNGNLLNLIANNNQLDFINHYLNIMTPHYHPQRKATLREKYADSDISRRKGVVGKVMGQLIATHAIAGFDTVDGSIKKANFLAIMVSNQKFNQGEWIIRTMSDVYDSMINVSNPGYVIRVNGQTGTNGPVDNILTGSLYRYANTIPTTEKDKDNLRPVHDDRVIISRLNKIVDKLHKSKVDVYIKQSYLK